jgi:hypothetical protein
MIPRGEVGLIFAGAAASLEDGDKPLISPGAHVALIMTVFVTSALTPPLLAWRIRRRAIGENSKIGLA